jgi:hypothetical protein
LRNGDDRPKQRGQHLAAARDREPDLLAWVTRESEKSTLATHMDIRHYCAAKLSFPVTRGALDSVIGRHLSELINVKSTPQEKPRLQVPRIFLEETIRNMQEAVNRRLSDFVFNLDEIAISEWEDRKSKKVMVPGGFARQTVHHGISRNLKNITITMCLFTGGVCLVPRVVTFQAIKPVWLQLGETGIRVERDLHLKRRQKVCINGEFFVDYIRVVFLPTWLICTEPKSDPARKPRYQWITAHLT